MKRRLIVTGCGRSGTGYMSRLLSGVGVRCGHEAVFGGRGVKDWGAYEAESSWAAVPWLSGLEDAVVIHVVREPVAVVSSFCGLEFFRAAKRSDRGTARAGLRQVVRGFAPAVFAQVGPVARATAYWAIWNEAVEAVSHLPKFRVHVDRLDRTEVQSALRASGRDVSMEAIERAIRDVPTNTNTRGRPPQISASQIARTPLGPRAVSLALSYGYDSLVRSA